MTVSPGKPLGRFLAAAGCVAAVVVGMALLPGDRQGEISQADYSTADILPEPVAATHPPGPRLGVLTNESFALELVTGLGEYETLVGPVRFGDRYWLVGAPEFPAQKATLLSSADGSEWIPVSEINAAPGQVLRVDQIASANGKLLVVGAEGSPTPKSYWPLFPGALTVWTSGDGSAWTAETLTPESTENGYGAEQLIASGSTVLLTGWKYPILDAALFELIPPDLDRALAQGELSLRVRSGLEVVATPGIVVWRQPSDAGSSLRELNWGHTSFLYRFDGTVWQAIESEEIESLEPFFGADLRHIAALPEGGFLIPGVRTGALTSDSGIEWRPEPTFPMSNFYLNWDEHLAAPYSLISYWISDNDGFTRVDFPREMIEAEGGLALTGSPAGLVANSMASWPPEQQEIRSGGYTVTYDRNQELPFTLSGPELSQPISFSGLTDHRYDSSSKIVTLVADQQEFEFPLAALQRFHERPRTGNDLYVAADGIRWSRPNIVPLFGELRVMGGGPDFLLLQTIDQYSQPVSAVYRAEISP